MAVGRGSSPVDNTRGNQGGLRGSCAAGYGSSERGFHARANKGLQLASARLTLFTTGGVWQDAAQVQSTTRRGLSQLKPDPLAGGARGSADAA